MKEKGAANKILNPRKLMPELHDKTHFKTAFQQMVSNEKDMQEYYCKRVLNEQVRYSKEERSQRNSTELDETMKRYNGSIRVKNLNGSISQRNLTLSQYGTFVSTQKQGESKKQRKSSESFFSHESINERTNFSRTNDQPLLTNQDDSILTILKEFVKKGDRKPNIF